MHMFCCRSNLALALKQFLVAVSLTILFAPVLNESELFSSSTQTVSSSYLIWDYFVCTCICCHSNLTLALLYAHVFAVVVI